MNPENTDAEERTASGWERIARDALARDLEVDAQCTMQEMNRISSVVERGEDLSQGDIDLLATQVAEVKEDLETLRQLVDAE